jgi:hypothetical protein
MDKIGTADYEMQIRGSNKDRVASQRKLLTDFGNGHSCPSVYCGRQPTTEAGPGKVTRDKIYTARQGGRYRNPNVVPACMACNGGRNDIPWEKIKWPAPEDPSR